MTGAGAKELLERARTIAVVGCSEHPAKAAHSVPAALQQRGYRIVPVNPNATEILGERAYARLGDVPVPIDVVEVFRPPAEAPGIVADAIAIGAGAVWLQLGLVSDEARALAQAAGIDYVENLCMAVEAARHRITIAGA